MRRDQEFDEAFDRLFGLADRHARRLVGNTSVAEDLAAEALARTYARWPRIRTYNYTDAWVLRVVTNLAIDALASRTVGLIAADPLGPEDAAVLRLSLAEALRALPARQRDAVVLRIPPICRRSLARAANSSTPE